MKQPETKTIIVTVKIVTAKTATEVRRSLRMLLGGAPVLGYPKVKSIHTEVENTR